MNIYYSIGTLSQEEQANEQRVRPVESGCRCRVVADSFLDGVGPGGGARAKINGMTYD